ncbi:hypothetical protein [Chryseobacterium sp. 5_R23647]|uniref:hypothetical protein n=1 Tax=Chryseobacterium sp. 5_R23647 TaxID=2258964 RepID=UPI000E2849C3|nr:hypothetical protein [Chryseobacterium sp. 5_R23647]REC40491.1 hypothetical protein DRF69_18530 [Chryseobacterium sp. 5_R23647]
MKTEEYLTSGLVFYANSKLLAKNILIEHSYIEPNNDDHGLQVHDIEIKFISNKGFLYNYSIYTSYDDSIAPIQISRIIIDAVEELIECQTDE